MYIFLSLHRMVDKHSFRLPMPLGTVSQENRGGQGPAARGAGPVPLQRAHNEAVGGGEPGNAEMNYLTS